MQVRPGEIPTPYVDVCLLHSGSRRCLERFWHVGARQVPMWPRDVFPRAPGPFIRRRRDATGYERQLVVGQRGLIPWFAKEPKLTYPTNNARSEKLAEKASYKDPWKRGQRCIIPATNFDEP